MASRFFQFLLDFSAPGGGQPERKPARPKRPKKLLEKVLPAQEAPAQPAIENVAPAEPLSRLAFRHPRATRELLLENKQVAFELKRRKRRTIGFSVSADGLAVSAPQWVSLRDIDVAVQEKSGWILKKLQETRERRERVDAAQIDWEDGAHFPYLGERVRIVLDRHQAHGALNDAPNRAVDEFRTVNIALPDHASAAQIERAVQIWLMQQASQLFTLRLNHFAPQLNVRWNKLSLSSATTRWGSASISGAIRLNWRLMHFKPEVIDYVVVHELSHLRVMNHSPRFWATVHEVMPDYRVYRNQLKSEAIPRE